MLTITPKELRILIETTPHTLELIDVRNADEYVEVHISSTRLIPLTVLPIRMSEIDSSKQIIFICRSGGRSGQACQFVGASDIKAYNLTWGMIAYEKEFPTKVIHGIK